MTISKIIPLCAMAAVAAAGSAHAHATFTARTVTAEGYAVLALQVPHGCDGQATNEVRLVLPEGFIFAKPQPKPGWQLEIVEGEYGKSYDDHGKPVNAGPVEIRWTGGDLPDAYYDTFVVRGKISGLDAGAVMAFPATQLCGSSASVAWTEIAAPGVDAHSLESPAPTVTVVAAEAKGHDASGHDHGAAAGEATGLAGTAGHLTLENAFTRAMLPGQPVGGGFVAIRNDGGEDDVLVSAHSPAAGTVELHEMAMEGEVMKMRKLDAGIPLPAGQTVELKPGGLHMMFMQVKEPFEEGGSVPVTLVFEKAGSVEITLPVEASGPKHH